MVQADAARNYYADLAVPPNADENEIRKAFRQLALKYHPDRTPGREAEFVTKFQQIQAAHEILSDPAQRVKYDQERRKFRGLNIPPYNPNTPRSRPPPPSRPTYTTTTPNGSYYRAPPPKPTPQRAPPQHHTSYTHGADRFTSRNFRAPPTAAQQPNSRANVFAAWQQMKQPRGEEPRSRGPSNMNNPNGTPFGRSKSTKTPKKGFDPTTPGGDEGQARSSYRSNYERPAPSPLHADPLRHFKEQMEEEGVPNVPYAEGNRVRTPYFSTAGERTSMSSESIGRSSSVRNSPTHRPSSSADAGSYSDSGGRRDQRNSYHGHASDPFPHMYVSSSDDESPPPEAPPPQQPSFRTPPASRPDAAPSTFKSRSEESINMKFSPSDWHGKFEGKPDYFAPSMQKGASAKGRMSPIRGRPSQRTTTERGQFSGQSQPPPPVSPFTMSQSSQMPPPPPPRPPPPLNTQSTFPTGTGYSSQSAKFSQEAWVETFKEPSFILPQNTKETSPRRGSITSKRSKAVPRKPSVIPSGTSTNTDTQSERSRPKYQAFAEDATNGDGDAMDIDSDTPPAEKPLATGIDRTYQQGTPIKFDAPSNTAPPSPQDQNPATAASSGSAAAPSSATESRSPFGLSGLEGLKKVEPFVPTTNSGLSSVEDLRDTLPFKSKASGAHPTKPNSAQKLKYPPVPSSPRPPATLDEASIKTYFARMEQYVKSFREYNRTMMNHFIARETELETSMEDHFIQNRGETTKKLGFPSYVHKMKEDQAVMEAWKIAQEMHLRAMQACEEIRNKTTRSHAGR